ncbi:MAG TPA: hypothetical protein VHH73_13585, partial [Verrucomicrobiae bacterium]|nr:hypothetical protein [Verrucomicrobiae bacterium]
IGSSPYRLCENRIAICPETGHGHSAFMLLNLANHSHIWKFFRAGGTDQVRLETAADLRALDDLDPKLWVALSCPTRGL